MRVISGLYRFRKLNGYNVATIRPTMDRVKESLFAMINPYIKNSICLDLFSGTGSLGIEALSNGASSVYFVDNSFESIKITKSNIDNLNITDNFSILHDNYTEALKKFSATSIAFDIIFLDPPYGQIKISDVMHRIIDLKLLKDNGIIVCEYENEDLNDEYENIVLLKSRKYGGTNIKIYINRK